MLGVVVTSALSFFLFIGDGKRHVDQILLGMKEAAHGTCMRAWEEPAHWASWVQVTQPTQT